MFVSAEMGEEGELTLETERQMVGRGACASALWLKDRRNSSPRGCARGVRGEGRA